MKIISRIISRIKGGGYEIDESYPTSYVLSISFRRVVMLLRGFFVFCDKKGLLFVGAHTKIRAAKKLKTGKSVAIDRGCYIDAMSTNGIVLGNNCSIGKYTTIECCGSLQFASKGLLVGNNVGLGTHGFFGCAGGVEIGDDTIFGNYVSVHSENHNYSDLLIPIRLQGVSHKGIVIGSNCWIGAKVTILDGANIGNGCIIAAGSVVVSGSLLENGIYGGIPAKLIKMR